MTDYHSADYLTQRNSGPKSTCTATIAAIGPSHAYDGRGTCLKDPVTGGPDLAVGLNGDVGGTLYFRGSDARGLLRALRKQASNRELAGLDVELLKEGEVVVGIRTANRRRMRPK